MSVTNKVVVVPNGFFRQWLHWTSIWQFYLSLFINWPPNLSPKQNNFSLVSAWKDKKKKNAHCNTDTHRMVRIQSLRTCAGHTGGVFDGPVEAFVAVTDGGGLVVAGAVQRTLGAFTVACVRLEGAGLAGCRGGHSTEAPELTPCLLADLLRGTLVALSNFSSNKHLVSITDRNRLRFHFTEMTLGRVTASGSFPDAARPLIQYFLLVIYYLLFYSLCR